MMSKFNIKVETILDGIQVKANSAGVEIVIEPVFDECTDDMPTECAAFVHNVESGRFGVVSSNVEGFDIDEVTAFAFKPKMYEYAKAEGFNRQQCFEAFSEKILQQMDINEFIGFILSEDMY